MVVVSHHGYWEAAEELQGAQTFHGLLWAGGCDVFGRAGMLLEKKWEKTEKNWSAAFWVWLTFITFAGQLKIYVKKYFQTCKTRLQRSFSSNMQSSYQTAGHSGVELQLSIMNWWRGPQGLTPCQTSVPTCCASLPLISSAVQASMGALWGAKLFGGHMLSISK